MSTFACASVRELKKQVKRGKIWLGLMTEEQEKRVLELINDPPPGSELAKAKEFGVDLTLFVSALRRTPTQRARALSQGSRIFLIAEQNALAQK